MNDEDRLLAILAAVGVLAVLSQALQDNQRLPLRVVIGKAIFSAIASMSASGLMLLFTSAPTIAVVGVGCAIAVMGVEYLQYRSNRYFQAEDKRNELP